MNSIVVKPVNSEFVVVWIKLMIRKGRKIEDFNFAEIQTKKGPCVTITNPEVLQSLKEDFKNFRFSKLSMEEYFQCNIIVAKRLHSEKFFIAKRDTLTYQQVFYLNLSVIKIFLVRTYSTRTSQYLLFRRRGRTSGIRTNQRISNSNSVNIRSSANRCEQIRGIRRRK